MTLRERIAAVLGMKPEETKYCPLQVLLNLTIPVSDSLSDEIVHQIECNRRLYRNVHLW